MTASTVAVIAGSGGSDRSTFDTSTPSTAVVASGRACRASRVRSSSRSIRVNAVSPGATRTRLSDDAFTRFPEVIPELAARTAFGRVGEPDDIGEMVATLIGEESRRVTAQNIEVSGGYQP
ncbi:MULTISPECIES: SDR family oxidoreductase [unclassified Streptomyces]|uniref:SDR family oxidoreductase n=1 Tax=unclassified Streptomyces TaxID=2593676 RepID=UPI002E0EC706|nr:MULTISPECIES: SDR family oxidoreductase [unclassified Streptomyces]WSR23169.1 SDR family oxidoreductase [Streptomyces sp. NBC_01205]